MGWGKLASSVTTRVIPGDHASILRPPGVIRLGQALRAEIEKGEAALTADSGGA
jgi:hypothetical protein